MIRTNSLTICFLLTLIALIGALLCLPVKVAAAAPGDVIGCTAPVNLSNSPELTSVDPFLLADPGGTVHLFWAERLPSAASGSSNVPDALMYAAWNGEAWSDPVDIFLSPRNRANKRVGGIRGVLDAEGRIHLVWLGPDNLFFYGSSNVSQANLARSWQEATILSDEQSGSQYSIDIASTSSGDLHILYGRGTGSGSNRAVSYIRSEDGGASWTEAVDIYLFAQMNRGPSNVRLHDGGNNKLYATWTEWDESGNGQAVYFARSLDDGRTWHKPVLLSERRGEEYERDWTTVAVLGEDQLVAFWEGGWRAYRQAQYSEDGGATWSEPIDTLDWLIADNGFAEFLRDSTGRLHLFVFQRVREGNEDKGRLEGLWHTVWEGEHQWREPQLVGDPNPGNYVTVALSHGNQLFAAWFDYTHYETYVIRCQIEGAEAIAPQPLIAGVPSSTPAAEEIAAMETPVALATELPGVEVRESSVSPSIPEHIAERPSSNPGFILAGSLIPTLLIIVAVLIFNWRRRRRSL